MTLLSSLLKINVAKFHIEIAIHNLLNMTQQQL